MTRVCEYQNDCMNSYSEETCYSNCSEYYYQTRLNTVNYFESLQSLKEIYIGE